MRSAPRARSDGSSGFAVRELRTVVTELVNNRVPRDAVREGGLAIVLTVVSLTSFALPALLGASVAWLAVALGAALLTLVLLILPERM
jgi:hypothetical protein